MIKQLFTLNEFKMWIKSKEMTSGNKMILSKCFHYIGYSVSFLQIHDFQWLSDWMLQWPAAAALVYQTTNYTHSIYAFVDVNDLYMILCGKAIDIGLWSGGYGIRHSSNIASLTLNVWFRFGFIHLENENNETTYDRVKLCASYKRQKLNSKTRRQSSTWFHRLPDYCLESESIPAKPIYRSLYL